MNTSTKELTLITCLAVLITVSGIFKIPGPAGTDFQLSAPVAVAIAAVFGFKRYILAGIISSGIGFILGTQTLIHIVIALIFRVVVGVLIALLGPTLVIVSIAGPIGSIVARVLLSILLKEGLVPLIIASLPGLIFTSLTSYQLYLILKKVTKLVDQGVLYYG